MLRLKRECLRQLGFFAIPKIGGESLGLSQLEQGKDPGSTLPGLHRLDG